MNLYTKPPRCTARIQHGRMGSGNVNWRSKFPRFTGRQILTSSDDDINDHENERGYGKRVLDRADDVVSGADGDGDIQM